MMVRREAMPKRMTLAEIRERAKALGMKPGKMKRAELIRAVQTAEGHAACFGYSGGQCANTECCFIRDCIELGATRSEEHKEDLEQRISEPTATNEEHQEEMTGPGRAVSGEQKHPGTLEERLRGVTENTKIKLENYPMETYPSGSQDRADILAIMMSLEGQVDTSVEVRGSLEAEIGALQTKLSEGLAHRARLEEQVSWLEAQTAEVDQLRKDLSHAREEQRKLTESLAGTRPQLGAVTRERDSLTKELASVKKKLSDQSSARAQLETQIKTLGSQGPQVDQLRKDISLVTEERNKLANLLKDMGPRLEAVTRERHSLTKEVAYAQAYGKKLEAEKTALEARLMSFKDKGAGINRLRSELAEATRAREELSEAVRDLSGRLEASDTLRESLEKDLSEANDAVRGLREEAEGLRERLMGAGSHEADLRVQFAQQTAELAAARERIQKEISERRQAEEMLSEIKLRLLSLTQKKSAMPNSAPRSGQASSPDPAQPATA